MQSRADLERLVGKLAPMNELARRSRAPRNGSVVVGNGKHKPLGVSDEIDDFTHNRLFNQGICTFVDLGILIQYYPGWHGVQPRQKHRGSTQGNVSAYLACSSTNFSEARQTRDCWRALAIEPQGKCRKTAELCQRDARRVLVAGRVRRKDQMRCM